MDSEKRLKRQRNLVLKYLDENPARFSWDKCIVRHKKDRAIKDAHEARSGEAFKRKTR